MKKLLILFCFPILFSSCDDGDVIVKTFDFSETDLQLCGTTGNLVFLKINPDTNESLSLKLGENVNIFGEATTYGPYTLNGTTNFVNYRTYDGTITSNYFCQNIPPTSPLVTVDYLGASGTATFITTFNFEDNDGIPFDDELNEDSDKDTLFNWQDFDDDGDNVPTSLELDTENADGDDNPLTNPKDTDGDGIPDYLDEDDDGDGVLTRYEDKDGDLNPTNDITSANGIPDYLNNEIKASNVINTFREHTYTINKDIKVTLKNLVLVQADEQITKETVSMGTLKNAATTTIKTIPKIDPGI